MNERSLWTDQYTVQDQLGFDSYRQILVQIIRQADTPITIGVFGSWGSGKTSLMRMVKDSLDRKRRGKPQAQTVWFDAWKYDREDTLWRALLMQVLEVLRPAEREKGKEADRIRRELDDLQASLYRDVDREETGSVEFDWREAAKGTVKLGLSFLPLLSGITQVMDRLGNKEEAGKGLGTPKDVADHLVDAVRRKRIEIHRDQVRFLDQFQDRFSSLVNDRVSRGQKFVIFVDDLDRCLPEKAIEILEAIKLFLEAKRCVFVVGVDRRIIEEGIKVKYQSFLLDEGTSGKSPLPISGDEYLEKIVQIPFHLPPISPENIEQFARQRLEGEPYQGSVAPILAQGMQANPRKIKRVLNIFRLLWEMVQKREGEGEIEAGLLAKLVVIQSRWRDSLYADVIAYPTLLENLESFLDHRRQAATQVRSEPAEALPALGSGQEPKRRDVPEDTEEIQTRAALAAVGAVPEGSSGASEKTLVEKYADWKPLENMLLLSPRFKGKDLKPYIYLTATMREQERQEGQETLLDERVEQDLFSNDPTRIQAAVERIGQAGERQQTVYRSRLVKMVETQEQDLKSRIAAGNALGMLDDLRLGAPPLYEPEMVKIPAGEFLRGTKSEGGRESPQKQIYLDEFEIAKYPLTNLQYQAFLEANSTHPEPEGWSNRSFPLGQANHPVVNISWEDAQACAAWLSEATGKQYRLPTEAEWEKAARGTDGREYPWGNEFDKDRCNTEEGGVGGTTPVGSYPAGASPYGVLDVAGNVWEWCADWYEEDYYQKAPDRNSPGPEKGGYRVLRGGSWFSAHDVTRCAWRDWNLPEFRYVDVGVRFSRTSKIFAL